MGSIRYRSVVAFLNEAVKIQLSTIRQYNPDNISSQLGNCKKEVKQDRPRVWRNYALNLSVGIFADFDQEIPTGLPQVRLLLIAVVSLAAFTRAEKTDLHRKLSPI